MAASQIPFFYISDNINDTSINVVSKFIFSVLMNSMELLNALLSKNKDVAILAFKMAVTKTTYCYISGNINHTHTNLISKYAFLMSVSPIEELKILSVTQILLREKTFIDYFYSKFKNSAAQAAADDSKLQGLFDSNVGLVQASADNFDANIASPNGLKSTHSLALLLTQLQENVEHLESDPTTLRRIRKDEMKEEPSPPVQIQRYNGPKKPNMPEGLKHAVLPLKVIVAQLVSVNRAGSLTTTSCRP